MKINRKFLTGFWPTRKSFIRERIWWGNSPWVLAFPIGNSREIAIFYRKYTGNLREIFISFGKFTGNVHFMREIHGKCSFPTGNSWEIFMRDSIRTVYDIINSLEEDQGPGIFIFDIDFEKAFNSLSYSATMSILNLFLKILWNYT